MLSTGEIISICLAVFGAVGTGTFAFFKWGVKSFSETAKNLTEKIDALVSDEELALHARKTEERFKGVGKRCGELDTEIRKLQKELASTQLDVAKNYVTKHDLTILQQRLEKMIDDLGKHVDTKIDELRKWLMDLIAARGTKDG